MVIIAALILSVTIWWIGVMIHNAIILLVQTQIEIARGRYDATRNGFIDQKSYTEYLAIMRQQR